MKLRLYSTCTIAILLAITACLWSASANAETKEARDANSSAAPATLEEVVVTARKREENLQNVPIAVTAISGRELELQSITMVSQVALTVPGFTITHDGGDPSGIFLTIRGISSNDIIPTSDAPVAIYVDGMLWSRAVGADAALVDILNVQVLKGPQGTLFGRNTTGGALNITTRDPELNSFSGMASLTGGGYDEFDGAAVLNVPLVENKLAARLVYDHNQHAGYDVNAVTGVRGDSEHNDTFRLKLLATPTEQSKIVLAYDYFSLDQIAPWWQLSYVQPGGLLATVAGLTGNTGVLNSAINAPPRTTYSNDQKNNALSARTSTATITGSYDFGLGVLKAIGGYRTVDGVSNLPFDSVPFTFFRVEPQIDGNSEETFELQFNGHGLDDRLQYTSGLYLFKEKGTYRYTAVAVPLFNPANPSVVNGRTDNTSEALYSQGTYKITDALNFTGGLRYSRDQKALTADNGYYLGGAFTCTLPNAFPGATLSTCSETFKTASNDLDYLASFDYKFTTDVLGYAKVSHGYRSGGLNIRGGVAAASFGSYAPETALTYEVGLKSEFFDRRLRINADGYYTNYDSIQRTVLAANGLSVLTVVENAASAKMYGTEVDAQALLTDDFRLGATFSYIHAAYNKFSDYAGDHSREAFATTPKLQASVSANYTHAVGIGTMNLHADYGWQDTVVFPSAYAVTGSALPNFPISSVSQKPYGLLNLRLSYALKAPNVELAIFGRNVLNQVYASDAGDFAGSGLGFNLKTFGAPRVWGAQMIYKFGQ